MTVVSVRVTMVLVAFALASAACGGASDGDAAATATSAPDAGAVTSSTGEGATAPSGELPRDALDAHDYFVDQAPYWSSSARRCAALKLARSVSPTKLRELAKPGMSAADAETLYQAFVGCHTQNVLSVSVQSRVSGLTIDQSRCFGDAGPSIDDSKPFAIAIYRNEPAPAMSAAVLKKLQDGAAKCFTPAQVQALAASGSTTTR